MIRYTLTRLALLLLGLLVASVLIFLSLRVLPGDVAQLIAGVNSSPGQVEAIRERLGLDQPLPAQYHWSSSCDPSGKRTSPRAGSVAPRATSTSGKYIMPSRPISRNVL